jgi:hypothetical protein
MLPKYAPGFVRGTVQPFFFAVPLQACCAFLPKSLPGL